MRVFGISEDGTFKEFVKTAFDLDHQEVVLEEWLEANPDGFLDDDKILVIGRQVTTNLHGFVDLLGLDRDGNVVVVELKRDRTPRDTLAQALEYASFAEQLDAEQLEAVLQKYISDEGANLTDYHRRHFDLDAETAVAFNKEQRIVIVGQKITPEIRQTARYLCGNGLQVTCVEFTFFETGDGKKLLTHEVVVGKEAMKTKVSSGSLPVVTEQQFLDSLDHFGRPVFEKLLAFAHAEGLHLRWGVKGFSMNVEVEGIRIPVCFGYPPSAYYGQVVVTALAGQGSMTTKANLSEDDVEEVKRVTMATGLFRPGGKDLKCLLDREFTDGEVEKLIGWIREVVGVVRKLLVLVNCE
jgi:hypothetical protein